MEGKGIVRFPSLEKRKMTYIPDMAKEEEEKLQPMEKKTKIFNEDKGCTSKVCEICYMEIDHGEQLCPVSDVSKKITSRNDLHMSYTTLPPFSICKENVKANAVSVKISENTCEADLVKQFGAFGDLNWVRIAKTKTSKGNLYALVSFVDIDDAERAMNKLNADGYDIKWFCIP